LSSFYEGLELQPAVSSKKLAIFKPNQQLQAGDDQSIEEISTNDLSDEDTFELNRKFSKFLKMFAKNYYQQTNSNNFPTEKTNSISVLTNLNQKLPGNQI
jgi:trehalose-6-phosphatase